MWYLKLRKNGYTHGVSIMALKGKGGRFNKLKNKQV